MYQSICDLISTVSDPYIGRHRNGSKPTERYFRNVEIENKSNKQNSAEQNVIAKITK